MITRWMSRKNNIIVAYYYAWPMVGRFHYVQLANKRGLKGATLADAIAISCRRNLMANIFLEVSDKEHNYGNGCKNTAYRYVKTSIGKQNANQIH